MGGRYIASVTPTRAAAIPNMVMIVNIERRCCDSQEYWSFEVKKSIAISMSSSLIYDKTLVQSREETDSIGSLGNGNTRRPKLASSKNAKSDLTSNEWYIYCQILMNRNSIAALQFWSHVYSTQLEPNAKWNDQNVVSIAKIFSITLDPACMTPLQSLLIRLDDVR